MTPMTEVAPVEAPLAEAEGEFVTYPGSPFQLFRPYLPAGDQPTAIEGLVEGIRDGLSSGGTVTISGFGTFIVAKRVSRAGRDPRTGRAITIPSSRVPRFRASRALKAAIR